MGKGNPPVETRFKKGQSGNPNGRPKKIPEIDKLLADKSESDYQAIINALFKKAKNGDIRASEVLLDRAYGKAKQSMQIDGDININLTRKVIKRNDH